MRKIKTVIIILLVAGINAFAGVRSNAAVKVLSTKRDIFFFKANCTWVGATIEVLSATGEKIAEGRVNQRRVIIDFIDIPAGSYIINVRRGDQVVDFQYSKRTNLRAQNLPGSRVIIVQY